MTLARLGLPGAWQHRIRYTLLMTDFKEGAAFISLWALWKQDPKRSKRLHVVALSAHLIAPTALRARLREQLPEALYEMVEQLVSQWPLNLPGTHRIEFEGLAVTLTIVVGPIGVTESRLAVVTDAVWSDDASIAQYSAQARNQSASPTNNMLQRSVDQKEAQHAVVVGAGVAGAGIAHALALRGWRVQIIDVSARRQQQHGAHLAAALTPMISREDDMRARLSRAGSLRAQARWSQIKNDILWRCGALQLQRVSGRIVDLRAVLEALCFPHEWVRFAEAAEASDLAGMIIDRGGLFFSSAMCIQPERLIDTLLTNQKIERVEGNVARVERVHGQWSVMDAQNAVCATAPHLILAGAMGTLEILRSSGLLEHSVRLSAMHALGGEITVCPAQRLAGGPRCIVSGDGYVLPVVEGKCVIGSSYIHGAQFISPSKEGVIGNLQRAKGLLGSAQSQFDVNHPDDAYLSGWAGWRAVLPGRLPCIGPFSGVSGLWVATGFASRGLTWSSLAGDLIAAALNGEPLPLERDIIDKISQT